MQKQQINMMHLFLNLKIEQLVNKIEKVLKKQQQ
jgi:hypothetical protein